MCTCPHAGGGDADERRREEFEKTEHIRFEKKLRPYPIPSAPPTVSSVMYPHYTMPMGETKPFTSCKAIYPLQQTVTESLTEESITFPSELATAI